MEKSPLVSVLVVTYNSSGTVIETLESIKTQTYQNIELVISDDCSKDNTLELCEKWISKNNSRFMDVRIVHSEVNTGTGSNVNRGVSICHGEWIKTSAADDLLTPNCVSDYIEYVTAYPEALIVFSKCEMFDKKGLTGRYEYEDTLDAFKLEGKEQLLTMYRQSFVPSPTFFIRTETAKQYPFVTKYKFFEDYPTWINFLEKGIKFHFLNKRTVLYRIHSSVSHTEKYFVNEKYTYIKRWHFYNDIFPKVCDDYPQIVKHHVKRMLMEDIQLYILKNRKNLVTKILNRCFMIIIGTK